MSLMNQAMARATQIEKEGFQEVQNRALRIGAHLEGEINKQPWMKGMPPAKYSGRTAGKLPSSIPQRWVDNTFAIFNVEDITIGIRLPKGCDNTYDHYILLECPSKGCSNPTWVYFSKYQSSATLVDIVGRAILNNDQCPRCQAEAVNICPTCGN